MENGSENLEKLSQASSLVTFILSKINPYAGLLSGQLTVTTEIAKKNKSVTFFLCIFPF